MSMNVSIFSYRLKTRLPLLVLAAAKVQLFFKPASFFKKNFFLFFHSPKSLSSLSIPSFSFRLGRAKITSFPFSIQAFFKLFFQGLFQFSSCRPYKRLYPYSCLKPLNLSKNVAVVAGAKVVTFSLLPNSLPTFFKFIFLKLKPVFTGFQSVSASPERRSQCGCKSSTLFRFSKLLNNLFLLFFNLSP